MLLYAIAVGLSLILLIGVAGNLQKKKRTVKRNIVVIGLGLACMAFGLLLDRWDWFYLCGAMVLFATSIVLDSAWNSVSGTNKVSTLAILTFVFGIGSGLLGLSIYWQLI